MPNTGFENEPAKIGTLYTDAWYEAQKKGSFRSAREVLPYLFSLLHPSSVCDVGCGSGSWLAVARELGIKQILGIDGQYVTPSSLLIDANDFLPHDLTSDLSVKSRYDLAMSLEVAEHLPERRAARFVETLTSLAPVVLFGAAIPGQGGTGHINEQWPTYWMRLFEKHGYEPHDCIRSRFWDNPSVEWWYSQNTFLYIKSGHRITDESLLAKRLSSSDSFINVVHPNKFLNGKYVR